MNIKYKGNLLVIVGPTAVGKTSLSLELAERFNGEIISGDSMQVYKRMDIGTAKASIEEQQRVPHHLLDIKDPDESFSVAEFQERALEAIEGIQQRGKLPILVGGTGLYVKSVLYYPQYSFSEANANSETRKKWQQFLEDNGEEALWQEVHKIDPVRADRIHPNDTRRLIRILELHEQNQLTLHQEDSINTQQDQSPFQFLMIGLTMPRELLYQRINQRVDLMIEAGLVDEVKQLVELADGREFTSMQSLGYKEMIPYLQGKASLLETIEIIQQRTRQFAKRQLTWFRHMSDIEWFDFSPEHQNKNLYQIIQIVAGKFGILENK